MRNPKETFARVRASAKPAFGSLRVDGEVLAGDGGTFACHAKAKMPRGTLDVFEHDDCVVALLRKKVPTRWEMDGVVRSDTATGCVLTSATHREIEAIDDEMLLADLVDEADLPAVLATPKGSRFAVFAFLGDGVYEVAKGYDAKSACCALIVYG
ncbi:MAG TPA: hypothetical protein VGH28_25050 [Polyangiaceae bacterium]|jgi:hypothetical protein